MYTTTEGNKDNNQKLSIFINLEIKSKKLIKLEIEIIIKSTLIISRSKDISSYPILPQKFKIIPRNFSLCYKISLKKEKRRKNKNRIESWRVEIFRFTSRGVNRNCKWGLNAPQTWRGQRLEQVAINKWSDKKQADRIRRLQQILPSGRLGSKCCWTHNKIQSTVLRITIPYHIDLTSIENIPIQLKLLLFIKTKMQLYQLIIKFNVD